MINRILPALAALAILVVLPTESTEAQGGRFQEGIHYFEVDQPTPLPEGSPQILVEAFSYMCSHCNTFEPYITNWQQRMPEGVEFRRIPVVFGRKSWEIYARAYVTAEMMGVAHAAHAGVMDAIWKERNVMKSMEELAEFYAEYGVDAEKFSGHVEVLRRRCQDAKGPELVDGIRCTRYAHPDTERQVPYCR